MRLWDSSWLMQYDKDTAGDIAAARKKMTIVQKKQTNDICYNKQSTLSKIIQIKKIVLITLHLNKKVFSLARPLSMVYETQWRDCFCYINYPKESCRYEYINFDLNTEISLWVTRFLVTKVYVKYTTYKMPRVIQIIQQIEQNHLLNSKLKRLARPSKNIIQNTLDMDL